MSASDQIKQWTLKVERQSQAVFTGCVASVLESIKVGSAVTGSPGQPVDTGHLRNSWTAAFESLTTAIVGTNVEYAESIEDGVSYAHGGSPMKLRSTVGGFHSVKLTRLGWDKIVAQEAAKVAK